jgi:hypothetical protein
VSGERRHGDQRRADRDQKRPVAHTFSPRSNLNRIGVKPIIAHFPSIVMLMAGVMFLLPRMFKLLR